MNRLQPNLEKVKAFLFDKHEDTLTPHLKLSHDEKQIANKQDANNQGPNWCTYVVTSHGTPRYGHVPFVTFLPNPRTPAMENKQRKSKCKKQKQTQSTRASRMYSRTAAIGSESKCPTFSNRANFLASVFPCLTHKLLQMFEDM